MSVVSEQSIDSTLWPNARQELLLAAATHGEALALSAFRAWRETIDLEGEFDRGTYRLLPLLYRNMQRIGLTDPLMTRLKGVYRMEWCKSQELFHAIEPIVAELENNGIQTLLVKGAPLALAYYRNYAVRPMDDVDVVVRRDQVTRAIDLLERLGWRPEYYPSAEDLKFRHAVWIGDPKGTAIDLHWHFLYDACNDDATAHFWSGIRPLDFLGVKTRQLDPTNMLLHTIIHGVRSNPEPPVRWIPDALIIIHGEPADIDWDRMLAFARSQKLIYRLGLGLKYLAYRHHAPIPGDVLKSLPARPSVLERTENTVALGQREHLYRNVFLKQWVIFAEYCRVARGLGPVDFVVGFSHYLRYRWGLRGRREIVSMIASGLARRLR
jgi:hypothetical protein